MNRSFYKEQFNGISCVHNVVQLTVPSNSRTPKGNPVPIKVSPFSAPLGPWALPPARCLWGSARSGPSSQLHSYSNVRVCAPSCSTLLSKLLQIVMRVSYGPFLFTDRPAVDCSRAVTPGLATPTVGPRHAGSSCPCVAFCSPLLAHRPHPQLP